MVSFVFAVVIGQLRRRSWKFVRDLVIVCVVFVGCDTPPRVTYTDSTVVVDSPPDVRANAVSGPPEDKIVGILERLLRNPTRILDSDPHAVASRFLEAAFRDGDVATAIETIAWDHPRCRIGAFPCGELDGPAHRVGALLALIPSERLTPTGMEPSVFETEIMATLKTMTPAPDTELPYVPKSREALFSFLDHHGMTRYLLLSGAGTTWRVASLGRGEQIGL